MFSLLNLDLTREASVEGDARCNACFNGAAASINELTTTACIANLYWVQAGNNNA
jgi:hypothetical protein